MSPRPIQFEPKNRCEALASEIAEFFDVLHRIPHFVALCQKHGYNLVLRAFSEAKQVPSHKITKSRRALFYFLIRKYAAKD